MIEEVECTLCGRIATTNMDSNYGEDWHPYAFIGDREVSPACSAHKGHWNEEQQIWEVDQI